MRILIRRENIVLRLELIRRIKKYNILIFKKLLWPVNFDIRSNLNQKINK